MRKRGYGQWGIDRAKEIDSELNLLKTGADIEGADIRDSMYVYAFAIKKLGGHMWSLWPGAMGARSMVCQSH